MKSLVLAVMGLLCSMSVSAHDFEVDGIYYNITSEVDKTVEVTYSGDSYNAVDDEYSGSVTIPETVTYNDNIYSVISIGPFAFAGCSGLTSVEIPNSVTCFRSLAFERCSGLISIVIPNSVTDIYNQVFSGCSGLTSIVIPNNVTEIDYATFDGCSSLTSVEIPNSVTSIDYAAFSGCSNLTSVVIPNSVTSIGSSAFSGCSSLTSVMIPNSVTSVGEWAFSGCSDLTSVIISNRMKSIDNSTFANCSSLTSVVIPKSVISIGGSAFYACSSLTSVEIPNSVTSIGDEAFGHCYSLTRISIPNSVTSIGRLAFNWCYNLNYITSYISADKLFEIGSDGDVFEEIDKTRCILYVPYGAKETYAATAGWSDFTDIREMNAPTFHLTITSAGYATLYLDYAAEIPEGVEVYTAKAVEGDRLKMELVEGGVIPANTGVLVKLVNGTAALVGFNYTETEAPAIADNLFSGSVTTKYVSVPSNKTAFVLSSVDGNVGMYLAKLTDGSFLNNANKAYLLLANNKLGLSDEELDTSVGGAQLSLRFDFGDTTGVDEVQTETGVNNAVYDMYGRKVNTITTPGLYIVNGKKVWVK